VCICVCKCNVCECYSAVLVIRLTYTSTKTCIKNERHDYVEYIYPLSISKLREGYALFKCFSFISVLIHIDLGLGWQIFKSYGIICLPLLPLALIQPLLARFIDDRGF